MSTKQSGIAVGNELLGSCRGLHSMNLEHGEEDDAEFCAALDDTALRCETCDWWVEPSEIEDGECEQCREGA